MLRIERARLEDVEAVQNVLRETWLDTYGPFLAQRTLQEVTAIWHDASLLASRIQDPDIYFAVARDDPAAICGLVAAQRRGADDLMIYRLYVRPGHQQRGIGTALFHETVAAFPGAARIVLQVVADNQKGLAFWRKHGFAPCGTKQETVAGETINVIEMERRSA